MKIKRFLAKKVHGYLDFDVTFNDDLTLLTGINGSGKTTVVRGISALISPSLMMLANVSFDSMQAELAIDGKDIVISAQRQPDQLILSSSETQEPLAIYILTDDAPDPQLRYQEKLYNYYREVEAANSNHPVLQLIKSLPTPMLLGIERKVGNRYLQMKECIFILRILDEECEMCSVISYLRAYLKPLGWLNTILGKCRPLSGF